MWSAPPREARMLYILEDTVAATTCCFHAGSAYVYEASYGFAVTPIATTSSQAQREYGLTPDDVHDSFNLHVHRRRRGRPRLHDPETTKTGDYVDCWR